MQSGGASSLLRDWRVLEQTYVGNQYPKAGERLRIGASIGLSEKQTKVWFQNRRNREKRSMSKKSAHRANMSSLGLLHEEDQPQYACFPLSSCASTVTVAQGRQPSSHPSNLVPVSLELPLRFRDEELADPYHAAPHGQCMIMGPPLSMPSMLSMPMMSSMPMMPSMPSMPAMTQLPSHLQAHMQMSAHLHGEYDPMLPPGFKALDANSIVGWRPERESFSINAPRTHPP